jgi:uncharacterized protein YndB with AHSA1/START domain
MIAYAITKTVSIDAPVERVFKYLADAANWPKWAIVNVKAVKPAGDAWWHMETPSGKAKRRTARSCGQRAWPVEVVHGTRYVSDAFPPNE